jgi:ABC-type nitrate/sulfonate/bicarbonate transport system substrate-binding protein
MELRTRRKFLAFLVGASFGLCACSAAAQEKAIVGHSARAALSIGPLLYGIERGFYRVPVPLNIQLKKEGYHELMYAGNILQRPLTGLATSVEKIQKNPRQVQRMVRGFLRATRALKTEKAGFIAFAQKKYGYSKDLVEEAYKYLVDALSQDGFVDDRALQAAIDEAKTLAKIIKPINQSEVVDYSFLRSAVKQ